MKSKKTVSKRAAQKMAIRRARPIHKRVLLHPISILLLLSIAVFIVGWTYQAMAQPGEYSVVASVVADPLSDAATIYQPTDGVIVHSNQIAVNGGCQSNSYVKLYRNGLFAGVAMCGLDNIYHFTTSLDLGKNTLKVQGYNLSNVAGPETPAIGVIYSLNQPVKSGCTLNASAQNADCSKTPGIVADTPPLLLTSDFQYNTFSTGSVFDWTLDVEGGKAPYRIHIDWGDGETSDMVFPIDPVFHIRHTYKAGGYYPIRVRSVDANGTVQIIQLAALIHRPGTGFSLGGSGGTQSGASQAGSSGSTITDHSVSNLFGLKSSFVNAKNWLWVIWPSFLVVSLMVFSFWLGERQEYQEIFKNRKSKPRRV